MPKVEKHVFLTQAELKALFDAIKKKGSRRDLALFLLAYRHGLRASEVGLLRVSDLDLRSGHVHVIRLKGSVSGRQLLYPDEIRVLRAYLRERKDGSDVLFPSNRGTPISRWQVNHTPSTFRQSDISHNLLPSCNRDGGHPVTTLSDKPICGWPVYPRR